MATWDPWSFPSATNDTLYAGRPPSQPVAQQGFDWGGVNWGQAAQGVGGLMSSMLGKATPPPSYDAPAGAQGINFQPNLFDVAQTPLYGMLNSGVQRAQQGGMYLPPEYIAAMRNQANQGLALARNRANDAAAFDANKYGLLGSGSMAVRQGLNDEQYQRGMSDIENQILQQEFNQRNAQMQMLQGLLGTQYGASRDANMMGLDVAKQNQQAAQQNYQNQQLAQMAQWKNEGESTKSVFQNIASLAGQFLPLFL